MLRGWLRPAIKGVVIAALTFLADRYASTGVAIAFVAIGSIWLLVTMQRFRKWSKGSPMWSLIIIFILSGGVGSFLFWHFILNKPTQHETETTSDVARAVASLRARGLRLYDDIIDFLNDRKRNAPDDMQYPPVSVVAPSTAVATPPYMRETASLFVDQFESSIVDIHDEFAARGLQDTSLEAAQGHLSEMSGNIDIMVERIAEAIRKLALLTPPDNLYMDVSDDRLYEIASGAADNMEGRAKEAFQKLSGTPSPDSIRFFFYNDFKVCCLNQIVYLRAEIIRRMGPTDLDPDEMRAFNGSTGITALDNAPTSSISAVLDYVPKFRALIQRFRQLVLPAVP